MPVIPKKSKFMADAETILFLSDIGQDCDHCSNVNGECSLCSDYFEARTESGTFVGNFDTYEEADYERKAAEKRGE